MKKLALKQRQAIKKNILQAVFRSKIITWHICFSYIWTCQSKLSFFFETGLKHVNDQVNKLMEQNIVKKESYDEETILFVIRKKHFLI